MCGVIIILCSGNAAKETIIPGPPYKCYYAIGIFDLIARFSIIAPIFRKTKINKIFC